MVREDLVSSAVSFLQDPSVASASLDKRIAFLQSKNLTQEEIDVSLTRAGDNPQSSNNAPPTPQPSYSYQNQQPSRQPPGYGYGYNPYQTNPWGQSPLEPPRRDWRDWFIMATVTTGASYGLYTLAKRYILPLIAPPTPPQLESDKAAIDASFTRAFTLIDQLTTDTAELKASETQRTEKLDTTLKDVDAVIEDLKAANKRREAEGRIIMDQVQGLKELVPKALEGWKEGGDKKLEELNGEMGSLKRLLENRVGRSGSSGNPVNGRGSTAPAEMGNEKPKDTAASEPSTSNAKDSLAEDRSSSAPAPGVNTPKLEDTVTPSTSKPKPWERGDRRAAIPAWQMAASGKGGSSESSSKVEADA